MKKIIEYLKFAIGALPYIIASYLFILIIIGAIKETPLKIENAMLIILLSIFPIIFMMFVFFTFKKFKSSMKTPFKK